MYELTSYCDMFLLRIQSTLGGAKHVREYICRHNILEILQRPDVGMPRVNCPAVHRIQLFNASALIHIYDLDALTMIHIYDLAVHDSIGRRITTPWHLYLGGRDLCVQKRVEFYASKPWNFLPVVTDGWT